PAGFGDQQNAGGHIPWLQTEFPEQIQAAARNKSQVERGGTRAPHSMRGHGELVIEMDVDVMAPLAAGKSRGPQAVGKTAGARDVNAAMIEIRPAAALGGEHLLVDRVVDHTS